MQDTQITQITAYESIKAVLPERRLQVLEVIERKEGIALFELVDELSWPINCISGRVTELRKAGLIESMGFITNPSTNKKAVMWRVKK